MQIQNYEETIGNPYVYAIFDIYHPNSTRTDYNMELCKSKAGNFYVKFPDIKSKRNTAPKPYVRCSSYNEEKEKSFNKSIMDLLKPFLPGMEAKNQPAGDDYMPF